MSWIRNMVVILELFVGFGALYGGSELLIDPKGNRLGFRIEWLIHSPFSTYFIPGLVLFVGIGMGSLCLVILAFRKNSLVPFLSLGLGMMVLGWILFQLAWFSSRSLLQLLIAALGLILVILSSFWIFLEKTKHSYSASARTT